MVGRAIKFDVYRYRLAKFVTLYNNNNNNNNNDNKKVATRIALQKLALIVLNKLLVCFSF
jgi:hypothetical protein